MFRPTHLDESDLRSRANSSPIPIRASRSQSRHKYYSLEATYDEEKRTSSTQNSSESSITTFLEDEPSTIFQMDDIDSQSSDNDSTESLSNETPVSSDEKQNEEQAYITIRP